MKLSVLVLLLASLGVGFAAGSYFQPEVRNLLGIAFPAGNASSGALSENDLNSDATHDSHSGVGKSKLLVSGAGDLASILKETNFFDQTRDLAAYVDSLQPEEIPDAVEQMAKKTRRGRYQALSLLIGRWVETDPQGALAEIPKMKDRQIKSMLITSVYDALYAQDPAGTMSQIQQITSKQDRDTAMRGIILQMSRQDPAQALALSQQNKSNFAFNSSYVIFMQWAQKDLDQATQAALQLPGSQRQSALYAIMNGLSQKDPAAMVAWVNQVPAGQMQSMARQAMVSRLINSDPEAAKDYINSLPQNPEKNRLIQNAAGQLVMTDPQAAMTLIETLPPSQASQNVLRNAIYQWAQSDPKTAADYVNTLPPDTNGRNDMISNIASSWSQSDPQAAIAWISQLPNGEGKTTSLTNAIAQWAASDPAQAVAYIQTMPDGATRQGAMQAAAKSWGETDPVAALQWTDTFPDGPQKTDVYGGIAYQWAATDPAKAAEWLTQLPTGAARDNAVRAYIHQVVENSSDDFSQAYQLAQSVGNSDGRHAESLNVLSRWMQSDPVAATPLVQNSSLSADEKKQLLQPKQ